MESHVTYSLCYFDCGMGVDCYRILTDTISNYEVVSPVIVHRSAAMTHVSSIVFMCMHACNTIDYYIAI